MVASVLRMGDPRLLQRAREVEEFGTAALRDLVDTLWDTMHAYNGVGLAAPQIGVDLRIVVFGMQSSPRYPDAAPVPETVLINPVLAPLDEAMEEDWEGCLSLPGLRGYVPRYLRLRYRGVDLLGHPIDRTVEGFHARVVQHECDHLDGILYPMRMRDLARFGFTEVLFPDAQIAPDE